LFDLGLQPTRLLGAGFLSKGDLLGEPGQGFRHRLSWASSFAWASRSWALKVSPARLTSSSATTLAD